jgi:Fe-S cluster assembly scaffold protein SufB
MASDRRIAELRDERGSGGDFFVYLKPGYSLSTPPQHCFGAETRAEIKETMKRVVACSCADCKRGD